MPEGASITALLGPTNTGKTHRALECMLSHPTGMLGLPLRLLAREVYDKVSARVGEERVALVTGEEKRIPKRPSYWVCTVEAMPVDREVHFVGVDEVQLAAHPQRGHVFTERLLHARGSRETWLLGSDALRPAVEALVPHARFEQHPRLSSLRYAGSAKLHRLPPRSAVVAFSTAHVYELAERLKRAYGGVAVVLGALSPRTRNAQVAMFQAGEVQYLVATDAIGMGLNLAVEHVAFSSLRKFDGREQRALDVAELAQIAGRAGRYKTDGTFGAVTPLELPPHVIEDIEAHRVAPVRKLQWRAHALDFASVDALLASLHAPARGRWFKQAEPHDDLLALEALAKRPAVRSLARDERAVKLLWDVCTVPDFRKLLPEAHFALLEQLYAQLAARGVLDERFVDDRVRELDDPRGDVDTLLGRIAAVRVWTYVSHRAGWLRDPEPVQLRTRELEDKLSDALHDALVRRFVDAGRHGGRRARPGHDPAAGPAPASSAPAQRPTRSAAAAARRLDEAPHVAPGHPFASLQALRGALEPALSGAGPAAPSGDAALLEALCDAPPEALALDERGRLLFREAPVAELAGGSRLVLPDVKPLAHDSALARVGAGLRGRALRRLVAAARDAVSAVLAPLRALDDDGRDALPLPAQRLAYVLEQRLGVALAGEALEAARALEPEVAATLDERGVFLAGPVLYVQGAAEPGALAARRALARAYFGAAALPGALEPTAATHARDRAVRDEVYLALGYVPLGRRVVRADYAHRAARSLRALRGTPPPLPRVAGWLGCAVDEAGPLRRALEALLEPLLP